MVSTVQILHIIRHCENEFSISIKLVHFDKFQIFVEEYEDLLAPQDDIQEVLAEANEMDCQMYIILLANGLECARFLRFGDRYFYTQIFFTIGLIEISHFK